MHAHPWVFMKFLDFHVISRLFKKIMKIYGFHEYPWICMTSVVIIGFHWIRAAAKRDHKKSWMLEAARGRSGTPAPKGAHVCVLCSW